MKTIRFIGIALLTVFINVCFTSCSSGGDDDDDKGSGDSPVTTNKFLVKQIMTDEKGEVRLERTYSYDSKNRINTIKGSRIGNTEAPSFSYTYGDNSIESNGITYNVSNGRITSTSNGMSFTYDNDGYIISASKNGSTLTYTWSGGNLTYISYKRPSATEEIESASYEYTNLTYPQNNPYSPEVADRSLEDGFNEFPPLIGGYWGKTPKNLPKKYVYKYKGEVDETDDYEFTMQDGYPSIIKSTDERGHVSINTLEWK
jgi:hypothetical protein